MAFGWNRTLLGRSKNESAKHEAAPAAADWPQSLPAPDVREGGESTWEAWQEESRRMDLAFADTQPSDLLPLTTSAQALPELTRRGPHWSAEDVLAVARHGNRVCPRAFLWSALYVLLEGDRYADLRPPPTQPRAWASVSNVERRLQFRDLIDWAARHGKLDEMGRFIDAIADADWVRMGED